MTLREILQETVDTWAKIGAPAVMERFVLRNGKDMEPMPRIGKRMTPKECFSNATHYLQRNPGTYVEGYVLRPGLIPIHHAWVEIDGKAMDPTLEDAEECSYVGVPFETKVLHGELVKNGVYGLLDTGMINLDLIFRLDPELKAIMEGVMKR